jgi:hypothetical protein
MDKNNVLAENTGQSLVNNLLHPPPKAYGKKKVSKRKCWKRSMQLNHFLQETYITFDIYISFVIAH